MVLARDGVEQANFTGTVEGTIIDAPKGGGGFGYDPLFIPEGYDQTFAELGDEVKNSLSHRGRALREVLEYFNISYPK
jgi:XTP/dITP diphosphohydrolase